jgi:hypothetical protein
MYGTIIPETIHTVTGADAVGTLTFASNADVWPGSYAWLSKTDGSAQMRVRVVRRVSTNAVKVREVPSGYTDGRIQEVPGPNYVYADVSSFATGSVLCVEQQAVVTELSHVPKAIG